MQKDRLVELCLSLQSKWTCIPYADVKKKNVLSGITVPIIPGIMPIQGYNSFRRIINLCKVCVPSSILNALEPIKVVI